MKKVRRKISSGLPIVIFGNPQKFAIECVLDKRETDSPQYSFGHIAIWAEEFMLAGQTHLNSPENIRRIFNFSQS